VIEIVPNADTDEAAKARAYKRSWLEERGYRVAQIKEIDIVEDVTAVLNSLEAVIAGPL
jgi:very-short-patch-repair endonuclease